MQTRIQAAIAEEEQRAEKLTSLIQAAWLALMGSLYFAAPMAFSDEVPFEPVPWILALYAPFVGLRLWLAWSGRMNEFWTALALILDIGVLLALIFSFHIQYGQEPSFYLKAPTFSYLFLFIALRSLNYNWHYVLLAGALAATGWLAMLVYALLQSEVGLTRDFVQYIFGAEILIGAEIDKVVTLIAVAAVLSAGVARDRRLLERAVTDAVAHRDLQRFFSPDVANHIVNSEHPLRAGEGVLRQASILTTDLRGFTPFSQSHPPKEVLATLAEFQKLMVVEVFAQQGAIDKFLGDGMLAHFGAAHDDPAHAAHCLRAAEACARAATQWARKREELGEPALGYGVACACGDLLFGVIGDEDRLELTVIGDPVNLAAKLEKHTKRLDRPVITTRALYELAMSQGFRPSGEPEHFPAQRVGGAPEPIDLVALNPPA